MLSLKKTREYVPMSADPIPCQTDRWDWDTTTFKRQGTLMWEPSRLSIFQIPLQLEGYSGIQGTQIFKAAEAQPVPNINLMQFLLQHPFLVPEWVKDGWYLYFPIPVYWERRGPAYVRYIYWNHKRDCLCEGDTLRDGFGFTSDCAVAIYT